MELLLRRDNSDTFLCVSWDLLLLTRAVPGVVKSRLQLSGLFEGERGEKVGIHEKSPLRVAGKSCPCA
jgi:hypothetical protein